MGICVCVKTIYSKIVDFHNKLFPMTVQRGHVLLLRKKTRSKMNGVPLCLKTDISFSLKISWKIVLYSIELKDEVRAQQKDASESMMSAEQSHIEAIVL